MDRLLQCRRPHALQRGGKHRSFDGELVALPAASLKNPNDTCFQAHFGGDIKGSTRLSGSCHSVREHAEARIQKLLSLLLMYEEDVFYLFLSFLPMYAVKTIACETAHATSDV